MGGTHETANTDSLTRLQHERLEDALRARIRARARRLRRCWRHPCKWGGLQEQVRIFSTSSVIWGTSLTFSLSRSGAVIICPPYTFIVVVVVEFIGTFQRPSHCVRSGTDDKGGSVPAVRHCTVVHVPQ